MVKKDWEQWKVETSFRTDFTDTVVSCKVSRNIGVAVSRVCYGNGGSRVGRVVWSVRLDSKVIHTGHGHFMLFFAKEVPKN